MTDDIVNDFTQALLSIDRLAAKKIIDECKQKGLVLKNGGIYGQVIRFLAPLCITDAQLEAGLNILEGAMSKFKIMK